MTERRNEELDREDATRDDAGAGGVEDREQAGAAADMAEEEEASSRPEIAADSGTLRELESLRDRYLRLAAEYDNFRKRTEKERGEAWTRAQAHLVQQLLDPLDDLERVAQYNAENTSVQAILDGVRMVERKLLRLLESAGLEVLEASGQPFDPVVHEALMTAAAERQEDDESVGEVFQKGYRFKGDLLRPARVQVRKYGG